MVNDERLIKHGSVMVPMGVGLVGKARTLCPKGLGSSFAASSPHCGMIYKFNVSFF